MGHYSLLQVSVSYKLPRADRIGDLGLPTTKLESNVRHAYTFL